MPRIRTVKPSFFTSLTIADLTAEQRLTFIGLWTHCDDAGRCIYDPRLLKAALWPLDDRTARDVEADVCALTESSLMTHYKVDGRRYLAVANWSEHQRINRPVPSTLPGPSEGVITPLTCGDEGSVRTHGGLSEDSPWEGKGREGKGREGNEETRAIVATRGEGRVAAPAGAGAFDDFWDAYPSKKGKADALKAWRTTNCASKAEEVIAGAIRYRDDPNRDPAFTKLPAGWLRDGRWDDDPLPARSTGRAKQEIEQAATDDFFERAMRRAQDAEAALLTIEDRSSA